MAAFAEGGGFSDGLFGEVSGVEFVGAVVGHGGDDLFHWDSSSEGAHGVGPVFFRLGATAVGELAFPGDRGVLFGVKQGECSGRLISSERFSTVT